MAALQKDKSNPARHFYISQKIGALHSTVVIFYINSLIVTCYLLGKLDIRTSTLTRFKNETTDAFKIQRHVHKYQTHF